MKGTLTKRNEILNALRIRGTAGITNIELVRISVRYGAYLGDLYKRGYKITTENLGYGLTKYTLVEEPEKEIINHISAEALLLRRVEDETIIDREMLEEIMEDLGIVVRYKAGTFK